MSVYFLGSDEKYRCDTEAEAKWLIEQAKKSSQYTVKKVREEIRTQKQKGEIVDEWKRVIITKEFCQEKEPDCELMPVYTDDREGYTEDE